MYVPDQTFPFPSCSALVYKITTMFFQQINIFIIWTVYFANIKDTFRIVIHVLLKSEQKKEL